ncbi:MAG: threonine/serine dehydratase [Candidatus Ratteibacteria bacterium]|nr:threonine/serine dehydratase [Candidatus Ratteibacteria bacterium]
MITIKDVLKAKDVIRNKIYRTPLITNEELNGKTDNTVFLKLENLQRTGAFKIRGVINKIHSLSDKEKARGIICASSGNHGLGVVYIAHQEGFKATIVVPEITPYEKVEKIKEKASVIIRGKDYIESYHYALKKAEKDGLTFIHGFDDPYIIAGQGTVALEIFQDISDINYIVVPIGGGGLIAGTLIVVKTLRPEVMVVGVQAEGAPSMYQSWKKGKICELSEVDTLAEGIAVRKPGELNFSIVKKFIDDIVLVSDDEIFEGVNVLLRDIKVVSEPAGVVGLSAVLSRKLRIKNKKIVCIITGGNISEKYLTKC